MPVVNYNNYCKMLENASKNKFAFPAVNVTSMTTASAAMKAFAESNSDGIIQISSGGGEFASGPYVKDPVIGAIAIADYVHLLANKYNIYIALHTDHCQKEKIDTFLLPLINETSRRRENGLPNLFNSHMFDGSALSLNENINTSKKLLELCSKNEIILEVEIGVVGGEEDDVNNINNSSFNKLYTKPEDMVTVFEELSKIKNSKFLLAAIFGNVHGVYKPGFVKLKPEILMHGQNAIKNKFGKEKKLLLVFHGGSGSTKEEINKTLEYGVIKMNIDTDTQYAFTRPIVDHVFKNYDAILKIEGEVGNKKIYDPRSYLKKGHDSMCEKIKAAIKNLKSDGKSIFYG